MKITNDEYIRLKKEKQVGRYPIFSWTQCAVCKQWIRWELIWGYADDYKIVYVCNECAVNKSQVLEKAIGYPKKSKLGV